MISIQIAIGVNASTTVNLGLWIMGEKIRNMIDVVEPELVVLFLKIFLQLVSYL